LPTRLRFLNLAESFRAEILEYLRTHRSIKLHRYFHHLNSSQAFAFNLFFPYFATSGPAARGLSKALGIDADAGNCQFEVVLDSKEGTNVDVAWSIPSGAQIFCEVKLSEAEFGTAENDDRHRWKLANIYKPRLEGLVSREFLTERAFFANYQLLRNVSLLASDERHQLVLLMPNENKSLKKPLGSVLSAIDSSLRRRVHVAHIESCLVALQRLRELPPRLIAHAELMQDKYLPT
jgi:hypothetical protein